MKYRFIVSLCFILSFIMVGAQSIGEWIVYPYTGAIRHIEDTGNEVFVLAGGSLYSYLKQEDAIVEYSKLDGLSDADIAVMKYDESIKTLVIVYSNQNIDLLVNGVFVNIPDFKDKVMAVNKQVNNIHIQDKLAYLATSFGVVVVNLQKKEIADTYNLGIPVQTAFKFDNKLCVASSDGIQGCDIALNPYDANNWKQISSLNLKDAVVTGDKLYGLTQNNEFVRINSSWYPEETRSEGYIGMEYRNKLFYLYSTNHIRVFDAGLQQQFTVEQPGISAVSAASVSQLWLGNEEGLKGLNQNGGDWQVRQEKIVPNATLIKDPYDMRFEHGNLYMVTGGPFRIFGETPGIVSVLKNGVWQNIDKRRMPAEEQPFIQLMDIAVSPFDPDHFMVGSFSKGVYEFKEGKFYQRISDDNDELTSLGDKGAHIWASALNMDKEGNLWIVNSKVDYPLRVRTAAGKWYKYRVGTVNKIEDIYPLMITKYTRKPQKWFLSYYNALTLNVFDENGTFDNTADDKSVTLSVLTDQDGNSYKDISFRSVTEDREGKIWLGTNIGPMIISDPENIFSSSGRCTRLKIARNDGTGLADYLLDNVPVICIVIDAANRKWIGTSGNGVYLLSADGLETIHHFTSENSPLPSNEILSMTIDSESGKVYFGCQGGLVAYQSDAIEGKEDLSEVYAYPNPVRPDYQGVITVTGLMDNTLVKITDINNNLIYQSNSLGGQFTWDGLNAKGEKVKSGIYLVYGSAQEGKKGVVTKIMFIR